MLRKLIDSWRRAISPAATPPAPVYDDVSMNNDLSALNDAVKDEPFILLADFLQSYKYHLDAVPFKRDDLQDVVRTSYFSVLSGLSHQMADGRVQFIHPAPGMFNYPEKGMFFPEHCYVPADHLVAHAQGLAGRDDRRGAQMFIQALRDAAVEGHLWRSQDLLDKGYMLEDGTRATAKFYMSAYENGSSFALVLRHKRDTSPRSGL